MTNSEERSFKVWYICNICKNRAYKNPKHLLQHKIDFHLPQNENKSKQKEKSHNIKMIEGVSETILKFTEAQRVLHLETMVNSLEDKSNRLVRLAWNSNDRNLILGEDSFPFPCSMTKKRKKNSQKRGRSRVKSGSVVRIGKKANKDKPPSLICKTCKIRFGSRHNLIIHERVHSGERPFPCEFHGCTYAGISQWNLTRHQRTHETGNRQILLCHLCKKHFSSSSSSSKRGNDQLMNRCPKCQNVTHLQNSN